MTSTLGYILGFVELGDINKCIDELETKMDKCDEIATHMLVFMIRGLFIKLEYPYAQFPCHSLNSGVLYSIVWDVVRNVELLGLRVIALTADGVSYNRKFVQMHRSSGSTEMINKIKNRYTDEDRYIYFFSDVPHLLKTARNCLANSFAHTKSRKLWVCIIYINNYYYFIV